MARCPSVTIQPRPLRRLALAVRTYPTSAGHRSIKISSKSSPCMCALNYHSALNSVCQTVTPLRYHLLGKPPKWRRKQPLRLSLLQPSQHTRGRKSEENYKIFLPVWGPAANQLSRTYLLVADVYGAAHCSELPLVFDNLNWKPFGVGDCSIVRGRAR